MPLTVSEELMTKRGIRSPAEDHEAASLSRPARAGLLAVAVGVLLSTGCASNDLSGSATAPKKADDLQVVDCRLPADVRQIGRQFIYHRQTIKTSSSDCEIRGGSQPGSDPTSKADD